MKNSSKILYSLLLVAMLFGNTSCVRLGSSDYLSMLRDLRGTSYWTLQCSTYITTAHHFAHHCGAAGFWSNGCNGALVEIEESKGFSSLNRTKLQPGDVIAFHGAHVAAYMGDGKFMDSDPNHNGVGDMTPNAIPGDLWFKGEVKVLRWKS